jgi:hypothetical protein
MAVRVLIRRLQLWRRRFGPGQGAELSKLLRELAGNRIRDPRQLIEIHEILLFLSAYPPNAEVRSLCERELRRFGDRVTEADEFEDADVSGIAGTHVSAVFGYEIARHLLRRFPGAVSIDWERFSDVDALSTFLPRVIPLLDEDALVEAGVPWRDWLEAAAGGAKHSLSWLLDAIDEQEPTARLRDDRYLTLRIPLRWNLGKSSASRTRMRLAGGRIFYHTDPLLGRKDVDLRAIPSSPPLTVKAVPRKLAEEIIALARETSAQRFRELHGFNYGSSESMVEVDAGRGVRLFVWGLLPDHRLPLRTYHAATIWKNGVPIGYFEGLSLYERMEAGFNLYYTFRDGESAWLYQQLLKTFHLLHGVTVFTVDPYQLGHGNEEAIESGAYWFYRKLGFQSEDAAVEKIAVREEKRVASRADYRSSADVLRELAESPAIFAFDPAKIAEWRGFQWRRVALNSVRSRD